jgi:hypothetical protein
MVADELNISYDTVKKYTRTIRKKPVVSPELIKEIRENVQKYKSKLNVARMMGISYEIVRYRTQDIRVRKDIAEKKINKIRREVLNGKSKSQIAANHNISYAVVCNRTRDLPSRHQLRRWQGISGKTLDILKKLLIDGYFICTPGYYECYLILKKHFPSVQRVKMHGCTILFLKDKSNIAAKAFLERSKKKIMSYQELNRIVKVFDAKLEKNEKKNYISL